MSVNPPLYVTTAALSPCQGEISAYVQRLTRKDLLSGRNLPGWVRCVPHVRWLVLHYYSGSVFGVGLPEEWSCTFSSTPFDLSAPEARLLLPTVVVRQLPCVPSLRSSFWTVMLSLYTRKVVVFYRLLLCLLHVPQRSRDDLLWVL